MNSTSRPRSIGQGSTSVAHAELLELQHAIDAHRLALAGRSSGGAAVSASPNPASRSADARASASRRGSPTWQGPRTVCTVSAMRSPARTARPLGGRGCDCHRCLVAAGRISSRNRNDRRASRARTRRWRRRWPRAHPAVPRGTTTSARRRRSPSTTISTLPSGSCAPSRGRRDGWPSRASHRGSRRPGRVRVTMRRVPMAHHRSRHRCRSERGNPASSRTATPSFVAFSSFEPGSSPATT